MNNLIKDSYPQYLNLEEDTIDFKRYLSLFVSNWYWFAIGLFIAASIAYSINRWSEKVYTVSATLLIKDDQNASLTNIFPGSDGFYSQKKINNEIGILKSYNLNFRVMQALPEFSVIYTSVGKRGIAETRMYGTSPFIVIYDSLEKQIKGKKIIIRMLSDFKYKLEIDGERSFEKEISFGERFNEEGFDFIIHLRNSNYHFNPDASNRFYFYFSDPASLANQYRHKLSISPIETEASLVTLSTTGFVPEQEADYLNTLMKVYLDFDLEYKNQTTDQTIDFIENQLITISDSLRIAENHLERFRLNNKLISISQEGSVLQEKLGQIDGERTKLLMQKNYYEYLKNYINGKDESSDLLAPTVMEVTDQFLITMVEEFSSLQTQKRQLSINLYESSEPLRLINSNILNVRKAISESINNGLLNIDNLLSKVEARLVNVETEVRRLPSTERQMINIQRKFDINNSVYTFLLEKRAEAGIARASNVPDNRVIDQAGFFSSAKIKPKEKRNMMTAVILGLLTPLFLIMVLDFFNNKILDKKDIEKCTKIPVFGYISHNNLKTELPVVENPGSTLSESFRSVRANLKYFLNEIESPVISITSTITSEGKTYVSANLAAILAMSGKKILLIGMDLRKPRTHKILTINNEKGLSNFLIGEEKFEDVIFKSHINNLWFTPAGPIPPNPAELIESDAMKDFIKTARLKFDYIIIDTPPVAIVTDALLISTFTDFYLFVVRQRYSSKKTLELIEELRRTRYIDNAGIVVNDITTSGYYGYGLRYGYAMGYGYNYGYSYYDNYGNKKNPGTTAGYYKD